MVQHWLADRIDEMTEVNARIKEETLVREWQQAMGNGVLRLTDQGPVVVDAEQMIGAYELELAYAPKPRRDADRWSVLLQA